MPVEYRSTRGDTTQYQLTDALLTNTAPDGGLLVPTILPDLRGKLDLMARMPYAKRAAYIVNSFKSNLEPKEIEEDTTAAYGWGFDHPDIVPVVHLQNNQYLLELGHGPTGAFKDLGMRMMAQMFYRAVRVANSRRIEMGENPIHYILPTSTSGDTGGAAGEAFKDLEDISTVIYYPFGMVSRLNEMQMKTLDGNNQGVYGVRGNFDDAQRSVKAAFDDQGFIDYLRQHNIAVSSANSINWGRVMPQIIYHFSGYLDLVNKGVIEQGEEINITVPSGNFGNMLSAFYAKEMGLPVAKLVCASNENNVLTDFLQTGIYDIRDRPLVHTPSPSMDILIASNIERLLHAITGSPEMVNEWMSQLKSEGTFRVDAKTAEILCNQFYAGWVSNDQCLENIQYVLDQTGYLMDPHTSVAQAIAQEYIDESGSRNIMLICSTAHWSKFSKDVLRAVIGNSVNLPRVETLESRDDEFDAIRHVTRLVPGTSAPENLTRLAHMTVKHGSLCDASPQGVEESILLYLTRKGLLED